jgi:hypothetical protein
MVRKSVLAFIQGVFEAQDPGSFKWQESLQDTEIVVTDESPLHLDVVGKRPAIGVVRGPVRWGQTSLDEMQKLDQVTGMKQKTDLLPGTVSINCCSRADLESEYLAWVVANTIWLLRDIFMKYTKIHEFGRGISIGSPSPAGAIVAGDTEGEWICTTVQVPFHLQVYGKITPKQNLIQAIEMRLSVRGNVQAQQTPIRDQLRGTAPNAPRIRGRVIRDVALVQSLNAKKES